MRSAFPDAWVFGYEHLVDEMDNHPKDRHVAAAAVHVDAPAVVTYNVRDFVSEGLRFRNVEAVTPPELVDGVGRQICCRGWSGQERDSFAAYRWGERCTTHSHVERGP